MFCKKCGNSISSNVKFCGKCGEEVTEDKNLTHSKHVAGRGKRFSNYILDHIFGIIPVFFFVSIWGLIGFITSVTGTEGNIISDIVSRTIPLLVGLSVLGAMPLYHVFFEYFWQKTPAKWLTKTKVVCLDGSKPGFWRLMGRNFARWIPFEVFSFLFTLYPRGWHDRVSGTMVVPDSYTGDDVLNTNPRSSGKLSVNSKILTVFLAVLYVTAMLSSIIINSASETNKKETIKSESWFNYISPNDPFSITLPEYPTYDKKDGIPVEDLDLTYSYHKYQAVSGKTSYFIFRYIYSEELEIKDEDLVLNSIVSTIVNASGGENLISTFGYYKGYRSLDFSFDVDGESVKGRTLLVDQTPYLLMSDYYPVNYSSSNYDKFINSFTINKQTL